MPSKVTFQLKHYCQRSMQFRVIRVLLQLGEGDYVAERSEKKKARG